MESQEKSAEQIWAELDAEEEGSAAPAPETNPELKADPEPKPTEETPAASPQPQTPPEDPDRALLKQIPELAALVKTTMGRVGALQSELQKIGNAAAKGAGEQPTQKQIEKASADPEKWSALKKDFPDWAEGVEAFVSSRIPSAPSVDFDAEVERRLTPKLAELQKARQEDAMEIVASAEPDWEKLRDMPEFGQWLATKPADYQQRAQDSWKPSVVLGVLRDFKREGLQPKPTSTRKLAAAEIPRGTQRVNMTKPVDEMSPEEYWAYLDEQESRQRR